MACTRRRFLMIAAAAAALPGAARGQAQAHWRGRALGAEASVTLAGVDAIAARPVLAAVEKELARLERVFSLVDPQSALSRLNARGFLAAPPADLVAVMVLSDRLHRVTGGAFDPSVQPLWQALAQGGDVEAARALVGWDGVDIGDNEVRLARPGMALTLNGIAQGHITDRIAALLRARGFGDILVDMGEVAGFGHAPDGGPWIADIAAADGRIVRRLGLSDRALATSAPGGTVLSSGQGHILSAAGLAPRQALVAVSAGRAAVADGLSTALCLLDAGMGARAVAAFEGARIEVLEPA